MRILYKSFALVLMLMLVLLAGCATQKTTTHNPETAWIFHDLVDVSFVQKHVTVLPSETVMIIDSRPKKAKYDKGHIPTAVSIPDSQFEKMAHLLPQNKETLLVFYCEGPT